MLDKTFDPQSLEGKIYEVWEASGAFASDPSSGKKPYTKREKLRFGKGMVFTEFKPWVRRFSTIKTRPVLNSLVPQYQASS